MDILEKKENQITFKADIEESLANAIRRYIYQIPVLAVDEVDIMKNDSPLYDETVAHRIGLIPLKTDKYGEGKIKLKTNKEGVVHSGELKGPIKVVYENIPITHLNKGQELEMVASVKAGKGSEHVKFAPGLMFYRNISEITLDKSFLDSVKKLCPEVNVKEKGDKIVISDDATKEVCDVCEGICNEKGKEAEVETKEGLIITLESFGQLGVKDIFKKSIDALKKDLAEISKKVK